MTSYNFPLVILIALAITSCEPEKQSMPEPQEEFADRFVSDVIGVKEKHLNPDYWTKSSLGDKILMSQAEITVLNTNSFSVDDTMFDLAALPEFLSKDALTARITSISKRSRFKRIFEDGTPVTETDFSRYEANLNLSAIKSENSLKFALAVKRTSLRTYPTLELLFSDDAQNRDIERFQETALFPTDIAVVLHESTDGEWLLVQSYNYIGWAQKKDIAIGVRSDILAYKSTDEFLVITGDKVHTTFNPEVAQVSELQLDMGIRLPLDRPAELKNNLYGQNPYLSHMVKLPIRMKDGTLAFKHALISRNKDVNVGYLPYTEANIIAQAFKFLGERYGWGHRYNGRDCTGFVSEIYKSFGILMPRNSGDQGRSLIGSNTVFEKTTTLDSKISTLKKSAIGDIIYMPGHVLMVLGTSDGEPFVIHDVAGLGYLKQDDTLYKGTLNGVSITPLTPLRSTKERTFVDTVYNVKSIR
ncbi:MAG: SH3 domain-containing protein [Emcibacter sp.]|nr:SH3 domain-containing protein [Emcibacter sp.]